MSKFQVGDQVRILKRGDVEEPAKHGIEYTNQMQDIEDCVAYVREIDSDGDLVLEVNGDVTNWVWHEDWVEIEGLTYADQWTAATKTPSLPDPDALRPQSQCENEARDPEAIMNITRNMCRG